MTSGLRRTRMPPAPIEKTSAETTRYHSMLIGRAVLRPRSSSRPRRRRARRAPPVRIRSPTEISRGSSRPVRRRASTTAPTAATSSSIEATSNASRKSVSSSCPICSGVPKPSNQPVALAREDAQAGAEDRDRQLDEQRAREQRARPAQARRAGAADRVRAAADVGDDEQVQHHDRADVDDHLGGRQELRAQQQEERGEREQVADERQHRVERVAQRHRPDRAREGADRRQEEEDLGHAGAEATRPPSAAACARAAPRGASPS